MSIPSSVSVTENCGLFAARVRSRELVFTVDAPLFEKRIWEECFVVSLIHLSIDGQVRRCERNLESRNLRFRSRMVVRPAEALWSVEINSPLRLFASTSMNDSPFALSTRSRTAASRPKVALSSVSESISQFSMRGAPRMKLSSLGFRVIVTFVLSVLSIASVFQSRSRPVLTTVLGS